MGVASKLKDLRALSDEQIVEHTTRKRSIRSSEPSTTWTNLHGERLRGQPT